MRSPKRFTLLCPIILLGCLCAAGFCRADALPAASPAEVGLDAARLQRIEGLVLPEIEAGNLPGCVVLIARGGRVGYCQAFGNRQVEPTPEPMTTDTVFDMASLTKPVATATSVMLLVERGRVRLRDPVSRHVPGFGAAGKEGITVEQLLTHQGGLIPDNKLSDYQSGTEQAWANIYALKPKHTPGTKFVYTDVGFLALGKLVEEVTGQDVATFSQENVFGPLGMEHTRFTPPAEWRPRVAPTEKQDGRWLRGEVHDPRAALLGGVAGHAGLFSTAQDLAVYAEALLSGGARGETRVLGVPTVREMTRARNVAGQLRALGWDNASKYSSNRGEFYSASAFGHGGFTGTAMWIDPRLDLSVVFLSNRLHPDGKGSVNDLAGRIGTLAAGAITGPARDTPVPLIRRR